MKNKIVESIKVWDTATGAPLRTLPNSEKANAASMVFSPDGKKLAFANLDGTSTLQEAGTGKKICQLPGERRADWRLLFSKDGTKLYARSFNYRLVREWDVATGKLLRKLGAGADAVTRVNTYGDPLYHNFSLSPDGNTLILAGPEHALRFLDVPSGKEIAAVAGHVAPIQSLQFTPDGKNLWTRASNVSLHKWDAATAKNLGPVDLPPEATDVAVSPDGKVLAVWLGDAHTHPKPPAPSGDLEAKILLFLDAANGKELGRLALKTNAPYLPMLFSPDGKLLAIELGNIELYEVPTGKQVHALERSKKKVPGPRWSTRPKTMLFSPDSKTLAAYDDQETIGLWNTTTGQRIGSLPLPGQNPLHQTGVFSPDGRCLALDREDGTVTLFELATAQPRRTFGEKLPKRADRRESGNAPAYEIETGSRVAFSPDGKSLAHAGLNRVVHLWDVSTGNELATFKGHEGALKAIAFAPDGKTIASASADTTVLIWDVTQVERPATPMQK